MKQIDQSKPTKLEWLGFIFVVGMFVGMTLWAIEILVEMQ